MSNETLSERELDRYCWLLVSARNRFYPPEEMAEECIRAAEESDSDDIEVTERSRGHEYGYHSAAFIFYNEMIDHLYSYGTNVMARANRYTKVNRDHGVDFRLPEDPDYYHCVDGGAEVKVMTNPIYNGHEIESIGEADYVPRGVELGDE